MKTTYHQRGLSTLGLLFVLLIIGFLATCVIKLMPHYMDSWTLDSTINKSLEQGEYNGLSVGEIRKKIGKYIAVNRIDAIDAKQLKISRAKGKTLIDATYEKRIPFMFNLDVIMKFDKLTYEFSTK